MQKYLLNISNICYAHGVEVAVLSPGSRVAPLSVSFIRSSIIKTYTFSDERSAAYIALGISQTTERPVVLCCTSGTAMLNYYPAIVEAFYRYIPLIILTADRPPEWIDQKEWDKPFINNRFTLTI